MSSGKVALYPVSWTLPSAELIAENSSAADTGYIFASFVRVLTNTNPIFELSEATEVIPVYR